MKNKFSVLALAVVVAAGIITPVFVSRAFAQGGTTKSVEVPTQGIAPQGGGGQGQFGGPAGPPQGQFPGGGPRGGNTQPMQAGPMPMMMGGGGNAVMVADGNYLFILQGNNLYKVNKDSLKVVATGELPRPQMRPMGGGFEPPKGGGGGQKN